MATRPDAAGASARRGARIDRQKCGVPCAGTGESGDVETTTRTLGHGHGNRHGLSLMIIIISYQPVLNNRRRDS